MSVNDVLCPDGGHCPPLIDGILGRFGGGHYTATFSRRIVPVIVARAKLAGVPFGGSRH